MRINIIQIDVANFRKDAKSNLKILAYYLKELGKDDLTVFPECFNFYDYRNPASNKVAIYRLEDLSADRTYIAGGYIIEKVENNRTRHNRAYLIHRGYVIDYYDKHVPYKEEIARGQIVKAFSWGNQKCIPLICADAYKCTTTEGTDRIISRARVLGASPSVPIVICSYSIPITQSFWTSKLQHLANERNAPLVICNIAGTSRDTFTENGKEYKYGGGGSGLFLAGIKKRQQFKDAGIICIDTDKGEATYNPFADRPFGEP
jgi:predicted amidohydrolase